MKRNTLIKMDALDQLQKFGAVVLNSSSALTSQGVEIYPSGAIGSEVWTSALKEVKGIDGPGGQTAEIDVTDLSSTAKEFVLGLQDEGDITLDMNYIPSDLQHAQMRADKANGSLRSYQIRFTDSPITTWTFEARVKSFSISNAVDNVTSLSAILRVSGAITEA